MTPGLTTKLVAGREFDVLDRSSYGDVFHPVVPLTLYLAGPSEGASDLSDDRRDIHDGRTLARDER